MSGHSKWSQIKRAKQADDQKRGLIFSKLAKAITVAVRLGGGITDPAANFRLRLAIDRAKAANMPKVNIERAVKRATASTGQALEEVQYAVLAAGGVAVIIEAATDNRARTKQTVKRVVERNGARLVEKGSISYLFDQVGLLLVEKGDRTFDEIFSIVAESGALDLEETNSTIEVYTEPEKLHQVKEKLKAHSLIISDAELILRAKTTVSIKDKTKAQKVLRLLNALEEIEDVVRVFANFDIPKVLLKKI